MNLKVDNGVLVYRKFGRDVKLPITNMTEKIYDNNSESVAITTTLNSKSRIFTFLLSEISRPVFSNFNDMKLWFDINVDLIEYAGYITIADVPTDVNQLSDADGEKVPAGGTTGQVLKKVSDDDGDTDWENDDTGDVTSVNGETGDVVLTTGDIAEDADANYVTDAQLAALHPQETATTIGALIGGSDDATPNDTDFVATSLTAGGILKKITWTNVKAFLKTYFDTLYATTAGYLKLDQTTPQTITNDQPIQDTLTASEIVATTAAKKLQTLTVATYPSLTELSYVKGVTSPIQAQIDDLSSNIDGGNPESIYLIAQVIDGGTP